MEDRPIEKTNVIERINGDNPHILFRLFPTQSEEFVNQPGSSNDSRSAIKRKTVLLVDIGAPSRLVTFLNDRDIMPLRLQTNSRTQPTKTATNHNNIHENYSPANIMG